MAIGYTWLPLPHTRTPLLPTLENYAKAIEHFRRAEELRAMHAVRTGISRGQGGGLKIFEAKRRVIDADRGMFDIRELITFACVGGYFCSASGVEEEGAIEFAFDFARDLWEVTQDTKARGLIETLAMGSTFPSSALDVIEKSPNLKILVEEEASLLREAHSEQTKNTLFLWQQIDALRVRMKEDETLRHLLQVREGKGAFYDDVELLQTYSPRRIVFADWVLDKKAILLVILAGNLVFLYPVGLTIQDVVDWKTTHLKTQYLKTRIGEARLQILKPLIAPLLTHCEPDDLLVLCPTGPLHGLPLHAIPVESKKVLIERNPITYTPSIAILRHCLNGLILHRGRKTQTQENDDRTPDSGPDVSFPPEKCWKATIMSCYESDNPDNNSSEVQKVHDHIDELSQSFNTKPTSGSSLTVITFSDQVVGAHLIHFHGHATFNANDILSQALVLADGHGPDAESHERNMTVPKIFELKLSAPHVCNIACDSGRQDVGHGDETLGITSAFLYAGASSVLGTLWPISSASGRAFSEKFYDNLRNRVSGPVDLAVALQQTVSAIRRDPKTSELYHWAGFVLYGLWFCPPVVCTDV